MVDNISQVLQRFIDEDKMCLDPKSRYSLSRKAKKKTLAIEKLLSDAPSLNKMSRPPPPQGIGSSSIEGFKDFESRISMMKEVLEALRDDNINMIAICGGDASDIAGSLMIRQLLQKSEILRLQQIKDLEYVIDTASNQNPPVACTVLEELELSDLSNLKEIYHGQFLERSFSGAQLASFGNLRCLKLLSCKHLKNVFSLSIARGLVQLHELDIVQCDDIEEIFSNEREDEKAGDMIKFPKLTYISLLRLPRLIGFCKPTDLVEFVQPSHPKSTQPSPKQEV
ncbi:probable disease resistance protein At4g27220 [Fagus crenata]